MRGRKTVKPKASQEGQDYFTARMEELRAYYRKTMGSASHHGERGRELETQVKKLLFEYLPNKYRAETGFVRSLEKPGWQSNQIDIILARNDICYPIAVQDEYEVFPIESVFGFVEVTSTLTRAKLRKDYVKVAELQKLYKRLYYLPEPPASVRLWAALDAPQPRFYYFAFSTTCSERVIRQTMLELSNKYHVQLHSIFILNPGYCFIMDNEIPGKGYKDIRGETNPRDAIIEFLQYVLVGLQTADFLPANASIPFRLYFDPNFRLPPPDPSEHDPKNLKNKKR